MPLGSDEYDNKHVCAEGWCATWMVALRDGLRARRISFRSDSATPSKRSRNESATPSMCSAIWSTCRGIEASKLPTVPRNVHLAGLMFIKKNGLQLDGFGLLTARVQSGLQARNPVVQTGVAETGNVRMVDCSFS